MFGLAGEKMRVEKKENLLLTYLASHISEMIHSANHA